MKDLSLHLLDIIQNSIQAEAKHIGIGIKADRAENTLELMVDDDGRGMDEQTFMNVTSPFCTSRTSRRIGLGIPLFKASAERCDGVLKIVSCPGKGTNVKALYRLDHIDRPPLGDITETILAVLSSNPGLSLCFCFEYKDRDNSKSDFKFDTDEVRQILKDVPLNHPDVLEWIEGFFREGIKKFTEVLNYEVTG